MIIDQCPHCGIRHVEAAPSAEAQDAKQDERWMILRCQNPDCNRLFVRLCHIPAPFKKRFQYPPGNIDLPSDPKLPPEVPPEYREAATCLAIGCHLASMTMSRRVLQRCLKQQGFSEKTLEKQIDAAKADGTIPKRYHSLADEIRKYGNIGAHPDDDNLALATAENAQHLLEFVNLLIHEFYELPAKADALMRQRK